MDAQIKEADDKGPQSVTLRGVERDPPQAPRIPGESRGARVPGQLPTWECTCVCCSRLTEWPKVFPQTSQAKGRVPLCERRACTSSPWGVENTCGWGRSVRPRGCGGEGAPSSAAGGRPEEGASQPSLDC